MIELALKRVYGDQASPAHKLAARERRIEIVLTASAFAVGFGLMPLLYAASLPEIGLREALSGASGAHILLNGAANALAMAWSLRLHDRFDRKIAGILTRVLMIHGVFAFIILIGRYAYSNQVMLLSALASAMLASGIMWIKHRATSMRVAYLGPKSQGLVERRSLDWIDDPQADLTPYDLLLTPSVIDLDAKWARCLSNAMLMGKTVRLLPEYLEEQQGIVSLEHFDFEHLPQAGLLSYRMRKRVMDIALVLGTAVITLPLLALGGLLVLLLMGRPVFFVQDRVGLGGRTFRIFKLRTMTNAPGDEVRATQSAVDNRITPLGRWLRRLRIDELPQLWNVLVGDMSVIGPRPEWTRLSDRYVVDLPVYAYRHLVRPGITGWAQVRGGYASDLAETRTKVGYDLFYIKNMSFSLDIQILGRTIWTLLSGKGAR